MFCSEDGTMIYRQEYDDNVDSVCSTPKMQCEHECGEIALKKEKDSCIYDACFVADEDYGVYEHNAYTDYWEFIEEGEQLV